MTHKTVPREEVRRILGELAGHASLCWDPRPSTEVFDTKEATRAVNIAMAALHPEEAVQPTLAAPLSGLIERLRDTYEGCPFDLHVTTAPVKLLMDVVDALTALADAYRQGAAAMREAAAAACVSSAAICAELGLQADMERRNGWLGAEATIRSLPLEPPK